jgi:predicted esterase
MTGRINFLSKLFVLILIIANLSACNSPISIGKTLISPSTSDLPPLLPESLSNEGKEYHGRTQVTYFLETPDNTPINADIYLSGTFDNWSGGNSSKYKFNKVGGNTYKLIVKEDAGSILQFKVTRGSWGFGEVDERGRRIGNRVLIVRNKPLYVKLTVRDWNDKSEESANVDTGYWDTPTPDYQGDALKPSLNLIGRSTVVVSSLFEYTETGAISISYKATDISSNIEISGIPKKDIIGDYIINYNVKDPEGNQAIPISRMLRIVGNTPVNYTLRPVGATSSHYGYIEQLPSHYGKDSEIKYPLFIYHHGAGAEASSMNLTRITSLFELANSWDGGPSRIALRNHWNTESPLIVLSPQRSYFETDIARIDAFVDYAIKNYQVDPERIYMGGFSAGGYISWEYAIKYPTTVAAIIPLAGTVFPGSLDNICNAKGVAVWAFHGMDDPIVDVEKAKRSVAAFNQCQPKKKAKLTLFDGVGHSSHQQVLELTGMFEYSKLANAFDENIYTWLMSQSLQKD